MIAHTGPWGRASIFYLLLNVLPSMGQAFSKRFRQSSSRGTETQSSSPALTSEALCKEPLLQLETCHLKPTPEEDCPNLNLTLVSQLPPGYRIPSLYASANTRAQDKTSSSEP